MVVLDLLHSDKSLKNGGEGGIRTLGTRKGTTVFETAPFDHSGTSPHGVCYIVHDHNFKGRIGKQKGANIKRSLRP